VRNKRCVIKFFDLFDNIEAHKIIDFIKETCADVPLRNYTLTHSNSL